MRYREFENWSAGIDTVSMPRPARPTPGVTVVEHTDHVDRATFATVWNMAAERVGIRVSLYSEVMS